MGDTSTPSTRQADTSARRPANGPVNGPTNVVVLCGRVRSDPTTRTLPSGAQVVQFDVVVDGVVDGDETPSTAPVSISDPAKGTVALIAAGAEVAVLGHVNRRFFRVAGRTQSRTEVVARRVVASRRRSSVARLLADAAARLDR
jgi:single-stranded DNA-binding protein